MRDINEYNVKWDLYTSKYPAESQVAIRDINASFMFGLGMLWGTTLAHQDDKDVLEAQLQKFSETMFNKFQEYTDLGACDSEPRNQFSRMTNRFLEDIGIDYAKLDAYGNVSVTKDNSFKM